MDQVFHRAKVCEAITEQIHRLDARRAVLRDEIIAELGRHGTCALTAANGDRLVVISPTQTVYDADLASACLGHVAFVAISRVIIDGLQLRSEIRDGRLSELEAATFTSHPPRGNPYPRLLPQRLAAFR